MSIDGILRNMKRSILPALALGLGTITMGSGCSNYAGKQACGAVEDVNRGVSAVTSAVPYNPEWVTKKGQAEPTYTREEWETAVRAQQQYRNELKQEDKKELTAP